MASIRSSALKQAGRLASKPSVPASSRRGFQAVARVAMPAQRTQIRSYVSETKRDNAQVNDVKIEAAIRLDKKKSEKAGGAMSAGEGSNATVSPMAGKQTTHSGYDPVRDGSGLAAHT